MYKYGMRLRGFSVDCQPMEGLHIVANDPDHKYWTILIYDRKLTDTEVKQYELDYLGETPRDKL